MLFLWNRYWNVARDGKSDPTKHIISENHRKNIIQLPARPERWLFAKPRDEIDKVIYAETMFFCLWQKTTSHSVYAIDF